MPSRKEIANAIRLLSMDAVQKANSGHPGMPMGMADIAEVLWNDFLKHNPLNPQWINRDRFIISNGHGSMLLYSLLHLTGYADMSMEEIKNFRQLHSKTAGHPEYGLASGIETTTGPLGQGIANAVGMAIAERTLAAQFNRPGYPIVDHFTYVFLGDGCMMEGISHECCSLAGTLRLGKLIAFWDDNGISIDGEVEAWFTDDTAKRFEAYNWHVIPNVDGHDPKAIEKAIQTARSVTDKPSLICCKTTIAYGAPNLAGSHKAHGAALGEAEVALARQHLHWSHPPFQIPAEIYASWDAREKGTAFETQWQELFSKYQKEFPELATELLRRIDKKLPESFKTHVQTYFEKVAHQTDAVASRKASQNCLNELAPFLPEFLGGSADLSESNLTFWNGAKMLTADQTAGNYISYGVREFGMAGIMNGIALHGGFIPFGGTFLTFIDYAKNALRLAALMKQRVIFVLTHDSIGLGEDGPTHQPVEHVSTLRLTPNVSVWRPCDAAETLISWKYAIERTNGPTCLLLSRQALPAQKRTDAALENIIRGGYVLLDCENKCELIIIATGSEVQLAVAVAETLNKQGRQVRVVSMPSTDTFENQEQAYKDAVLPPNVTKRIAIEAGVTAFWYKYVGLSGRVIGLDRYGESAPAKDVFHALGFSVEEILKTVSEFLN